MNKQRRKSLAELISILEEAESSLGDIEYDERDARESMPDSFEGSEQYQTSEDISDLLTDAIEYIHEAIKQIEEAVGK